MADKHQDGVENAPGKASAGGESGGGAYPNGAGGDGGDGTGEGGFLGHGGQSHQAYSGPGDETDDSRTGEAAGEDNAVSRD